jgi:hypothetical protein
MHPDFARGCYDPNRRPTIADTRREEHAAGIRADRLDRKHGSRRWKLSWTMLSPRDLAKGSRQGRSTWTIIISASRPTS